MAARTEVVVLKVRAPVYSVEATGPDHDRRFTATVVAGDVTTQGTGSSKKQAEMAAALLNGHIQEWVDAAANSSTPNVTIGPGYPNTSTSVYTISSIGTGSGGNGSWSSLNTQPSGKIALKGEEADVDINGKSLKTWMEKVEERLNILTPNPELEKEWDDLRKLGERYRKLEKKCKEKAEVWKKLKEMPPPKVD